MSIKQEDYTPPGAFSSLVKQEVDLDRDLWYLENRIPNLGEASTLQVMTEHAWTR